MDEDMLYLMFKQVLLGRKAERGFKAEAYESVAAAMTEESFGFDNTTKRIIASDDVWKAWLEELRQILELSGLDTQRAHEWLIIHQNMATVFLTVDDKRAWIVRQVPKIREERL
ncbi:hypothetical protein MRB53_002400 [Persea americana]|uniref:Uncharacterized protein n=1 Tax=Persea americana TaxID=3435 RepID=A0ACC2MU85_PERAE|nr:hypothetical protein MRB53_002400 [Persea americana]